MQLSSEDSLRLNVLLANKPLAIRINESRMTVEGLMDAGETCIHLNPNQNDDKYLKLVRALLSEKALGNPGGYPSYLQRWSRMGQMREESLEQLLMLGELTAVYAVATSEGLTDEIARRTWWARDEADHARSMLKVKQVVEGETGPVLAQYLVEYLPFETETDVIIESIKTVLQPNLLNETEKQALWKKSARKTAYLAGFLAGCPNDLPLSVACHPDYEEQKSALSELVAMDNEFAKLFMLILSEQGQAFLETALRVFEKPPTQDVVTSSLDFIHQYCQSIRPQQPDMLLSELEKEAEDFLEQHEYAQDLLAVNVKWADKIKALVILSGLNYGVVRPILCDSTALGSLMRKKLKPILTPISDQLKVLRG